MAHQVLARKWRPRSFQEVVGQATTVRALSHSLDQNRLHHAYLFTGTRGVGKTSIARLFAKCLNCEKGISSAPCNQCQTCQAIDEGRFLDLLEVDAASRTKVEDTRDLLDNVQYAPTQGRYKIYLIDEVHMLSNHSFNALLKTLEEPPPHVKFLLATTDPQRLPVTVLSRCLQFHLKNLSQEQIAKQLTHILETEALTYESAALNHLAHAAQGSMRDALSLMDQAIAYTAGHLTAKDIKSLLGSTEPELLMALLNCVADNDAQRMLKEVDRLAEGSVDFQHALEELLSLLHQIALEQVVPGITHTSHVDAEPVISFAQKISAEALQLYYQIALIGRRDLPLAPTPRSGFEMVLLRMLAFNPDTFSIQSFLTPEAQQQKPEKQVASAHSPISKPMAKKILNTRVAIVSDTIPATPQQTKSPVQASQHTQVRTDWASWLAVLNLQGASAVLASHCVLVKQTAESIQLALDPQHAILLNKSTEVQIVQALQQYLQKPIELKIQIGHIGQETPAFLDKKQHEQRQSQAAATLTADTHLQSLMDQFNGKVVANMINKEKPDTQT